MGRPKLRKTADESGSAPEPEQPRTDVPISQIKEQGAFTQEIADEGKRLISALKRRRNGEKRVNIEATGSELYHAMWEVYGMDTKIGVKKTHPVPMDFGERIEMSRYPDWESFQKYIEEKCWNGERATFQITYYDHRSAYVMRDRLNKDEYPPQRTKWALRNKQEQAQAELMTMPMTMQPTPVAPVAAPTVPSETEIRLARMLERLDDRLDAIEEKISDDDDSDESDDKPGVPPMHPVSTQNQPQAPAQPTVKWKTIQTTSGPAYVQEEVIPDPPEFLGPPMQGCAWSYQNGRWSQVPIAAQHQTAQSVQAAAAPAAPATQSQGYSPSERELSEQLHATQVEIAKMQEREKVLKELRRQAESEKADAQVGSSIPSGFPEPPQGFAWALVNGKWQAVAVAVQQPNPVPATSASQSTSGALAQAAQEFKNTRKVLSDIAGAFHGESLSPFPKADSASDSTGASVSEDAIPLKPIELGGGMNYWFNTDERKPADGSTQMFLNMPGLMEKAGSALKEVLSEWRQTRAEEFSRSERKQQRDRDNMLAALQQQKTQIEEFRSYTDELRRQNDLLRNFAPPAEIPRRTEEPVANQVQDTSQTQQATVQKTRGLSSIAEDSVFADASDEPQA